MPYLLQTLSVVFPVFIKISSRSKLNGVQPVHKRLYLTAGTLNIEVGTPRAHDTLKWRLNHTQKLHSDWHYIMVFYLFDLSSQVLDKKPPQVVECLQLSALSEIRKIRLRGKNIFRFLVSSNCMWLSWLIIDNLISVHVRNNNKKNPIKNMQQYYILKKQTIHVFAFEYLKSLYQNLHFCQKSWLL